MYDRLDWQMGFFQSAFAAVCYYMNIHNMLVLFRIYRTISMKGNALKHFINKFCNYAGRPIIEESSFTV